MEIYSHIKTPFLFIVVLSNLTTMALGCTRVGFYESTCPRAEAIVQSVVQSAVRVNQTYAPGIVRMFFHDCFVNGCDASILIDGPEVEKSALQNSALRGFDVIHDAKKMLESVCPGVVSCADILALAARDSVVLSGGTSWAVPTGRRDGLVSRASDAATLPSARDTMDDQINKFGNKSLSVMDLVTLVGGHTIGTAACARFSDRLYAYNHTHKSDPTIDPAFLPYLRTMCPHGGDRTKRVAMDTDSVNFFDTLYYENLKRGRGVLASDSLLWHDPRTRPFVQQILGERQLTFDKKFGRAMVKLSNVEVKTGNQGEIRRVCNAIN